MILFTYLFSKIAIITDLQNNLARYIFYLHAKTSKDSYKELVYSQTFEQFEEYQAIMGDVEKHCQDQTMKIFVGMLPLVKVLWNTKFKFKISYSDLYRKNDPINEIPPERVHHWNEILLQSRMEGFYVGVFAAKANAISQFEEKAHSVMEKLEKENF